MKKKILKVSGIVILLFIVVLIAAPLFLESKIGVIIKNNVNNNVDATLDFSDADLSLFSSFPNAEVNLDDVILMNKKPFEGDTLFAAKSVALSMGIGELFKDSGEPISISSLMIDNALLHIKVDEQENTNYDIAKETSASNASGSSTAGSFTFNMESYEIKDSRVLYDDFSSKLHLEILDMHHNCESMDIHCGK